MQPCPDQFMEFHPIHGSNVRLDISGTQATRVESFANGVCFSKHPLKPGEIFLIEIEDKELGWCGHLRVGLTAIDPGGLDAVPEYSIPDMTDSGDSWVFAITRNHNKMVEIPQEAGDGGLDGGRRLGGGEAGGGDNNRPKAFFTDSHLYIQDVRIPRDKLVGRSRPGRYSHILDDLYKSNTLPPTARRSRIGVLYVARGQDLADMHIIINGEDMGASAKGIPSVQPLHAVVDVFAATKCVRIVQVEYGCMYVCSQCNHPLFSSRSKFSHSSPWPAFTDTVREDSVTKMMESLTAFKVVPLVIKPTTVVRGMVVAYALPVKLYGIGYVR
ncbi:Neuralized-like protein 2 [Liparis tanakae]|uniref:L-methionine (R)-S-oxide reductase n=1 Tax=Liparis tanakae TaxID=230148 RepID=A0A4Z2GQE0_9TELE|nr:Neuralized-like protein 2 [Liparis tanakae]